MALRLDFTNMIAAPSSPPEGATVPGVLETELRAAAPRFADAHRAVDALRADGTLGFFALPTDHALLGESLRMAKRMLAGGKTSDVVVLGIGGSALGPVALRTALRPSGWNMLDDRARKGRPRLHVLDNVDPGTIAALLDRLDLARTLFVVTSKSGGTAETMAQYLVVRAALTERKLPLAKHIVFVTDPLKGALRPIAAAEGIPALPIPANVGGRFSVLTPVGIFPAALMGIDVSAMLEGAADMVRRCESDDMARNPAGLFATLQWLAHTRHGKSMHVLMPYSDQLRDFASWFVQLWAESLGKIRADGTHVGPTPIAALGATDQHSQVQNFMEGPTDKTVTFLAVTEPARDLVIPSLHDDVPDLAYLGGHTLAELLDVERRATAGALAKRGRPNMTLTMDRVDAWHVGSLIMLLEIATAYAGHLYGVNAFDQPGVELGKQFAYALLGRPGAEAARSEWDTLPQPNADYQL